MVATEIVDALSRLPLLRAGRKASNLDAVRTLLIDNFDSYTYNVWQLLSQVNEQEPIVVLNNAFNTNWDTLLEELPAFDNIVLSPGPGSPDKHSDFGLCLEAIHRAEVPLLGICLGHQGLAHAYGGLVTRANTPMHGRLSKLHHSGESLFQNVAFGAHVVRYHSLVADRILPAVLRTTAWTEDGTVMGLEHRSKPQYGVQFHPESIRTAAGRTILSNFRDITIRHHQQWKRNMKDDEPISSLPVSSKHVNFGRLGNLKPLHQQFSVHKIAPAEPAVTSPTSNIMETTRRVHITTVRPSPHSTATTQDVFDALYGEHAAAFWLDSQCPGPVELLSSSATNSTVGKTASTTTPLTGKNRRLSFMGAIDFAGAFSVEYQSEQQIVTRSFRGGEISKPEVSHESIFEYIRESLRKESNTQILTTHETIDLGVKNDDETVGGIESHNLSKGYAKHVGEGSFDIPFNVTNALFGYLGYEVGHEAMHLLTTKSSSLNTSISAITSSSVGMNSDTSENVFPKALFLKPSRFIVYDIDSKQV